MAKATVRKADDFHRVLGGAMADVMHTFGLSLKEFARELGKNERQIARQLDGTERPQIEAVFAVPRFQPAIVIALAKRATGVEVDTVIHVRRSA
jgi:ABC-type Zn2+ transport system substrate-binding protein/surface adhesin